MNSPLSAKDVKRHRWWGWGLDDVTFNWRNKPGFAPLAQDVIGMDLHTMPDPVTPELSEHTVPPGRLGEDTRAALVDVVGPELSLIHISEPTRPY